ncbi:hypothetical protein DUNSADRAFT_11527 [Dunaliella salina]|uniref:Uncharacterized protein n=1 Tax=Dunaliella salina TaxID=3046 RepID=A0ABQ7H4G4_DUNSA|nr:hypothetical protein DUNSADRAFT_11527 [Dunaliella salina]|eukprot:KAF5841747.1 hypothetical protein DUNSADRAFT_11527 [Dunaliella salina]
MDPSSHARVALTCVHELLLHLPNTEDIIEPFFSYVAQEYVGVDEHPALGIRHCLRVLQDDYFKPYSAHSSFRFDRELLMVLHHLVRNLEHLGKGTEAIIVMQLATCGSARKELFWGMGDELLGFHQSWATTPQREVLIECS